MVQVNVRGLVSFSANGGILVEPEAEYASPGDLMAALRIAWAHVDDDILVAACCGLTGPLYGYSEVSFEEYLGIKERARIQAATREAKAVHTAERRRQFNRDRDRLVLAMIDAGIPYVCSAPGCGVVRDLTIDHKIPLSRGGNDDVSNFQFMCQGHNSAKGDRQDSLV